jgi:hypothetical protein
MRSIIFVAAAFALSAPALAADRSSEATRDAQDMAEKLNNPAMQSAMAGGLSALMSAFLDMRVDGIAKALEPLNGGKKLKMKGRTVREMAERQDPRFEEKMQGSTRAAVAGMGALATAMATMMPQLEEAMGKMGDAMDNAKEKARDTLPDAR